MRRSEDGDLEIQYATDMKMPPPVPSTAKSTRATSREWILPDGDTQLILFEAP